MAGVWWSRWSWAKWKLIYWWDPNGVDSDSDEYEWEAVQNINNGLWGWRWKSDYAAYDYPWQAW